MKERNPWIVHSKEIKFKNAWFTIIEHQVTRPDGKPGTYTYMDKAPACGVVALTPEQEVYLVGQYRFPTDHYSWEIIEGGAEANESPLECIKRELVEEAGLIANKWSQLGAEIHLSNCVTSEVGYIFLAQDLSPTEAKPEGTEILQLKKLPLKEALLLIDSGEIKDGMTIIALLRLARLLDIKK